jgi:hypothetical protein
MKISVAVSDSAPIVLIYGAEGRGKTSLAAKFPKPLALLLERGLPRGVTVDAVEDVRTYADTIATLHELIEAPAGMRHL